VDYAGSKEQGEFDMSEALVRGVHISYEIIGTEGSWIALTPGSRRGYGELTDLARALASGGHRVLLHDRRNCGSSEVAIESLGSEHEIWADDLYELARQIGVDRLYVGGSSAGARLALLFAMRHTAAARGLLLWRVTGGTHAVEKLAESYYGSFIKLAQSGGMDSVARSEHFAELIAARPSNAERLARMDPADFIRTMEAWRTEFLASSRLPVIGATEEQLRDLAVPACIISGNDVVHPPGTARNLASLLPTAEFHDEVVEKLSDDHLREEWDRKEWKQAEPMIAQLFLDFMARH
jgi:pimeloyl-ACP methyl ester carboxylesterase